MTTPLILTGLLVIVCLWALGAERLRDGLDRLLNEKRDFES